jgi:hypothetical protein
MTAQPYRLIASDHREPVVHELSPLRLADQIITLHLILRRSDDGAWRGRLLFQHPEGRECETAEIFCGATEDELWQSVRGLRDHHLRALYLSLV